MSGNCGCGGSDQERAIRIKLEVTIPTGGAPPSVEVSGPMRGSATPEQQAQARLLLTNINNAQAVCLVPGTTNLARVFAVGTADQEVGCGFPHFAHGVVTVGGGECPGNAPPSGATFVPVNPSNGNWCFENDKLLEYATCGFGLHTVTVWYEYRFFAGPFSHYSKRIRSFDVDCTQLPLCAAPSAELVALPAAPAASSYGYRIRARGFSGADVKAFNGPWELRVAKSSAEEIVHESEPAKSGARVSLRLQVGAESRLEFRRGKVAVMYVLPPGAFRGGSENEFAWSGSSRVAKTSRAPKRMVLQPVS